MSLPFRFLLLAATLVRAQQPPGLEGAARSVVIVTAESGGIQNQGSGVVIGQDLVATNAHVVKNAQRIRVSKGDRAWYAESLCVVPDRDLVLLSIPGLPLPRALPAPPLREGQTVLALGYPGGREVLNDRGKVTSLWAYRGGHLIQSDTHCRPGSSGGGLFTEEGLLAGITTFNLSQAGSLDFSVPVDWVLALAQHPEDVPGFRCPPVITDSLLKDFCDLAMDDPDNGGNLETYARNWVAAAPNDPKAWFAQGTVQGRKHAADPEGSPSGLEAYRRAVALDPAYARAWNNLGTELDGVNRLQEAQGAFRRAVELRPGYALAWLNLGSSYLNSRNYREAIEAYTQGLALQGDDAASWARLAYCEFSLHRLAEAADHYRLALRYAPTHAEWWGELYRACLASGQTEKAREALERARALSPALAKELTGQHPKGK